METSSSYKFDSYQSSFGRSSSSWTPEETEFLLNMHKNNVGNIGPGRIFPSMIHLWREIALRLTMISQVPRSSYQCMERFNELQSDSLNNDKRNSAGMNADTITASVGDSRSDISEVIRSTLLEIHYLKEESKDRRHRERMQLLEQIFQQNSNAENCNNVDVMENHKLDANGQQSGNGNNKMREHLLEIQRKKMEQKGRTNRIPMSPMHR